MNENELCERYIRLAFQYESAIDALLTKGLILRQWELDQNAEFDDQVCAELIRQGHTTSLTITPTLWIRRTHAVGLHVKQGKGGGVNAYPEIAADFHLWLEPKERLAILGLVQNASIV